MIIFNLVGLTAFGFIGVGVWYLVAKWYWDSGKYGPYELPLWVEVIYLYFILAWAGIILTLLLTVWKPDPTIYTISISW